MKRREFLKHLGMLAAVSPGLAALLEGCSDTTNLPGMFPVDFDGDVIVIGAGAAGLSAAYVLDRHGIDVTVLEASPVIGGRTKRTSSFVDFPIDLGGEWIHTDPSVLARIVNDPTVDASVDITVYSPESLSTYRGGELIPRNAVANYYSEYKFTRSTWYGFLERHIAAPIMGRVQLDTAVRAIDHSGARVRVTDTAGAVYEADRVIVTAPLTVLQDGDITFTPPLPTSKTDALDSVTMPGGIKVFFEFSERFYPDIMFFGPLLEMRDRIYYDAAFGKDTQHNVLGLFCVGDDAPRYTSLGSDQAIADFCLAELDEIFGGRASANYMQHVVQNWTAEPFIRGSYSYTYSRGAGGVVRELARPIDGRLFFAGEATSVDNTATVHGACESGYEAARLILAG